jgi:hypothetical protein
MLGFLGNITSASCCATIGWCGIVAFPRNSTIKTDVSTQQCKRRRYYGKGVVICRETSYEVVSCVGGPEENGRIRCGLRISFTCVRILEGLLTVINSCVLNFECNKVPL